MTLDLQSDAVPTVLWSLASVQISEVNMVYHIYPKYFTPPLLTLFHLNFEQLHLKPVNVSKNSWMSDCVDPDQTPHSAAFDLGQHRLLRPVCPNT